MTEASSPESIEQAAPVRSRRRERTPAAVAPEEQISPAAIAEAASAPYSANGAAPAAPNTPSDTEESGQRQRRGRWGRRDGESPAAAGADAPARPERGPENGRTAAPQFVTPETYVPLAAPPSMQAPREAQQPPSHSGEPGAEGDDRQGRDGWRERRRERWGRERDRNRDGQPRERERQRPDIADGLPAEGPQRESLAPPLNIAELEVMARENIIEVGVGMGIEDAATLRKPDLILKLLQVQAEQRGNVFSGGFLEVSDDGNYGFLRGERMLPGPHDIFVSQAQLRRYGLRPGDYVTGQVRTPRDNEKYYGLLKVEAVNGLDPEVAKRRPYFENLTAIFPNEQLIIETTPDNLTNRIIDLVAPIGRGQRGLIVSPPKAGKTMLLKNIANGIAANYPDIHLMVVLIGERPEEVTDMRRGVRGEVVSSTFDEPVEDHTRVAEMAVERAKRLVEGGQDVVILMDSITRLTRAYNLALPPSGRTLSGGVDPVALYPPKRIFGAARKCEEAGSLTILATCLVDTGSRMDEVVFEEFKGTGNLELRLDRKLAERRFYPAIDIQASSTRREELLLDERTLKGVYLVRRMTAMISQNAPNQLEATERLLERLARTTTNEEFLASLKTDL